MKKSDRYIQGAIACGVFVLLLGFSLPVWAQPAGMLNAYGSAVSQGEYEGTLFCLRHDISQNQDDKLICQKEGRHHHVLVMDDGHMHPLYGQTEDINKRINAPEANSTRVRITGKYYPVSNAILVTAIAPAKK